jgi:hypothetical protein
MYLPEKILTTLPAYQPACHRNVNGFFGMDLLK